MTEDRDANLLFKRVDALIRRQQEDSQRAVHEVPILTEVVEPDAAATAEKKKDDEALIEDIAHVLIVRLLPELNKQISNLRGEMEKEMRRSVREAVAHAIARRLAKPDKKT
jgi:hypothetical protein